MEDPYIGLFGVVVGAVVGGLAQILAGVLQERRQHRQWARQQRREVYLEFLRVWWVHANDAGQVRDASSPPRPSIHVAMTAVEMTGSIEVTEAARAAFYLYIDSQMDDSDEAMEARRESIRTFTDAAREDVGLAYGRL